MAEANRVLACGYDYIIYIAEGDSLLGRLDVNTKCAQVIAYGVGTSFDCKPGDPFKSIIPDAAVYDTTLRSDTITRSRAL